MKRLWLLPQNGNNLRFPYAPGAALRPCPPSFSDVAEVTSWEVVSLVRDRIREDCAMLKDTTCATTTSEAKILFLEGRQ